jgi:hypothetical protein
MPNTAVFISLDLIRTFSVRYVCPSKSTKTEDFIPMVLEVRILHEKIAVDVLIVNFQTGGLCDSCEGR